MTCVIKKAIEDCESLDWYHDAIAFITFDIINSEKGSMVSKHLNCNLFLLHGVNYIKFISIYYVVEIVLQFLKLGEIQDMPRKSRAF